MYTLVGITTSHMKFRKRGSFLYCKSAWCTLYYIVNLRDAHAVIWNQIGGFSEELSKGGISRSRKTREFVILEIYLTHPPPVKRVYTSNGTVRYLSAGSDREAIKLYRSRCQNEIVVLPDMPTLAAVVAAGRYGRNFIFKPHNDRYRYNRYADDVRSADLPIFKPHPALHSLFFFAPLHTSARVYMPAKYPTNVSAHIIRMCSTVLKSRRCQWLANITSAYCPHPSSSFSPLLPHPLSLSLSFSRYSSEPCTPRATHTVPGFLRSRPPRTPSHISCHDRSFCLCASINEGLKPH